MAGCEAAGSFSFPDFFLRESPLYLRIHILYLHNMTEVEAHRAVRDSYLSSALQRDKDYVEHDTVEEWADFIYDEVHGEHLMQM